MMKIKQTILLILATTVLLGVFMCQPLYADCGGVTTSIINCDQSGGNSVEDTGVWGVLLLIINILTAGIGIAAVGGIIYGSILYITAGGSLDQTKQAKRIILNVAIGLVVYALMYSFMNFLIPGGMFN